MSLRGLAKKLGISPSAVSQIERGHLQPSIGRVIAITEALGVPLSSAFAPPGTAAGGPATSRGLAVARAGEIRPVPLAGGVTIRRLSPHAVDDVEFFESVYAPGSVSNAGAMVTHDGFEIGTVTAGELTVDLDTETVVLGPGDSISFPSARPHLLSNRSLTDAVATWLIVHSPGGRPVTPLGPAPEHAAARE
ncbi:MAG: helix-turn-helix transcriptional regulator [Sinomonas sp.]|nr:helix-turn-helix transcriptional regulator [Sinomonas sp.]